jgi:predicted nucleic acid-binding protein
MRTIVCDAGPIIHLYEAHCLPLLRQTGDMFLPPRVYGEVHAALDLKDPWPEWLQVETLSPHEQKEAGIWKESGDLHDGEAEALVLARRKKADWFLTDDSTTRLFVSLLGMEVHGSLGVVLWNAARRHLSRKETEQVLDGLEASSLWLSARIYQEARQSLDAIFTTNP